LNDLLRTRLSCHRMIWLLAHPIPPFSLISKLHRRHRGRDKERQLADRRGGGRGGAKAYDSEKAWFSINHSILSGGRGRRELRNDLSRKWTPYWAIHHGGGGGASQLNKLHSKDKSKQT
jgi:hypothetical protein